jgi:hypothetical protein
VPRLARYREHYFLGTTDRRSRLRAARCSRAFAASALTCTAAAFVSARRKARSVGLEDTKTRGNSCCCLALIPLPYLSLELSRQCMAATRVAGHSFAVSRTRSEIPPFSWKIIQHAHHPCGAASSQTHPRGAQGRADLPGSRASMLSTLSPVAAICRIEARLSKSTRSGIRQLPGHGRSEERRPGRPRAMAGAPPQPVGHGDRARHL